MSRIVEEQTRWLAELQKARAEAIKDAVDVLNALRLNGRQAKVQIETTRRAERVLGEHGPVDVRQFLDQTDFYFEIPEGPPINLEQP